MWEVLKWLRLDYPLDFITYFLLLLPIIIGIYRQKFLSGNLLAVVAFFVIRFIGDNILDYYAYLGKNNLAPQLAFLITDIVMIALVYYLSLYKTSILRKLILIISSIALVVLVVNYIHYKSMSGGYFFNRLVFVLSSLSYFNNILSENRLKNVLYHSMFWVSAGFLFLGMGTSMTSLFTDYLLDKKSTPYSTYQFFMNMNQIVIWIQCVLAAIGIWVSKYDKDNYIQPI